ILNELWHARPAGFPFCPLAGRNKLGKARSDRGRRGGLSIAIERRATAARSAFRTPPPAAPSSRDIRCKMSTARSSVLPPKRITAGMFRSSSQNALASPYADQYCSWLATPEPEPKYPTRSGWAKIILAARYTLDADGLPLVSVKSAIVNPAFTIASIDIMDPP